MREALIEAGLVSGIGGVIGALAAYPVGEYLLAPLRLSVGGGGVYFAALATAGILSALLGTAMGVAAAVYPAWTVARLMPADALREAKS